MMAAFDAMPNVNAGDVLVTRTANAAGTSFAFSLYFQGNTLVGFLVIDLLCVVSHQM